LILIDWINDIHAQFHLVAETFQLTVAIIDRYLQVVKDTKRSHLQLVGVTALFIAAKYEELFPPAITDFIYITDDAYTGKQIRQMELQILKTIDCNLSRPLPIHFLRRFSKAADAEHHHHAMSKYFLELAMIEYDMSHYKPSEIAAAALFLSLNLLKENINFSNGLNNKLWNRIGWNSIPDIQPNTYGLLPKRLPHWLAMHTILNSKLCILNTSHRNFKKYPYVLN
ncbi:hypothetical protein DOY81_012083, partial [Sarcophaga bullata]